MSSLLVASWVMDAVVDIEDRARRHFTDTELISGGTILAALLVISIIKKIIVMAVVIVVLAGLAIIYQNGGFDSIIDDLKGNKT